MTVSSCGLRAVYTALCVTEILDSEKLNPSQYNQYIVLTMPWIAWGPPPLGYGPEFLHDNAAGTRLL